MHRQPARPLSKAYLTRIGLLYGENSTTEPIGSTTKQKRRKQAVRAFTGHKGKATYPSEDHEQQVFMKWARQHPIAHDLIFHVPNQRKCSATMGKRLQLMGVLAGVSDLFLPYPSPNGRYHGLWIEMKSMIGKLQPNQVAWLDRMNANGYKAVVCHGAQQAIDAVLDYLK